MTDRRVVDELTIEELEQILYIKRREARLARLRKRPTPGSARPPRQNPLPTHKVQLPSTQPAEPATKGHFAPVQAARAVGAEPVGAATQQTGKATLWRRLGDRLLLLVELAALIGLLLVIGSFLSDLRALNEETARVQANGLAVTPTAEPVLLPGGNVPPTPPDKVPAPFRDLVQAVPVVVIPTPGPQAATRVVIPAIRVDAPVVEGDGWEELKKGVGHHIGSANPGERGNMVLSGHNDVFGEVFRRLTDLSAGDEVQVYDASGRVYRYRVTTRRIVEPTEVSVMRPTSAPILTLITCYPYLVDTQRLIVIAELIE